MFAVLSLLVVVMCSMIVVKVATVALTMTGLNPEVAHLQALSAFSGAGFTTKESESVVYHPVRRKIIKFLLLSGNAGITSAVAALVATVLQSDTAGVWVKLVYVAGGLVLLFAAAQSAWLGRILSRIIKYMLSRLTELELLDYATLLDIASGYSITEVSIAPNNVLAGKPLKELDLTKRGIIILGLRKARGGYEGVPHGETVLSEGDTAVCYGNRQKIKQLVEESAPKTQGQDPAKPDGPEAGTS